jgi:hypothetical protein
MMGGKKPPSEAPREKVLAHSNPVPEPKQDEDSMSDENLAAPDVESAPTVNFSKGKMYTVKFHSQEGPGGKDDIVVHVGNESNIGKSWRIKREHEVTIPEAAMDVIKNAKMTFYTVDEQDKKPQKREVDRFAYTIIRAE